MLDPAKGPEVLARLNSHEEEVIKLQAFVRGCNSRAKYGVVSSKKRKQKGKKSDKGLSDLEQKMISARSGQFRGGMHNNKEDS